MTANPTPNPYLNPNPNAKPNPNPNSDPHPHPTQVTVETDAADSTHRIRFEQLQVHEALGEGGFSIVYRGVYGKQQDGSPLQVALGLELA